MANKTVKKFMIKLREDRVYDLYVDNQWVLSRGSHENILEELKNNLKGKILYQITNEDFQRHLSSPSINSYGGIKKLKLVKIEKLHLF